jgi:S-DNA-T family DNA segregation ATPase FtsK/SpoIIIE
MENLIEQAYREFGIKVDVVASHHGPSLTTYELRLGTGLQIKKLSNLESDLAMKLSVKSVRYQIPFQNSGNIGLEVPNEHREVVEFDDLHRNTSGLEIVVGKDTIGNDVTINLAKLPHLLVAGQTGSGKSVALNCIISSLIKNNRSDEVSLLLIDPKMVEFAPYREAKQVIKVIDETEFAVVSLHWLCKVMDDRYKLLAKHGVRNIDALDRKGVKLPKIVVVIDELADLMSQAKKQVEPLLARLAQKSRAAGIHLVLATQRPSVNVITGILKANIPARMAFRVASGVDSSVILDSRGAESLLGNGDMLYTSPETGETQRIQGAYISDADIEYIVDVYGKDSDVRRIIENMELT